MLPALSVKLPWPGVMYGGEVCVVVGVGVGVDVGGGGGVAVVERFAIVPATTPPQVVVV
jgi:hypothetical protein